MEASNWQQALSGVVTEAAGRGTPQVVVVPSEPQAAFGRYVLGRMSPCTDVTFRVDPQAGPARAEAGHA